VLIDRYMLELLAHKSGPDRWVPIIC
jgi:hypothetical protein